ncbi:hypothetical protein HPB51_009956 [Rhipicephalus microplus]|uniref:Mucin-5ac n=1 Tax=Rhipicephalus microplus TaxID=6941 RepID=A0A9J6ESL1_RHIMP|nr:mucin-5AC-like [Rhipicephalus microplus]KAH8037401.1 hypothetical protein HPB51_009956 [Rhipicephalus microplus]
MAFWWVIMLLSSQVILEDHTVDATFDFSFRWLRDESTISTENWNATSAAVTTGTTASRTTPPDVVTIEAALLGRSTQIPVDAVSTAAPTSTTWTTETTDYSTTATTEATVPGATPVSLDDLALQIANVPDPILHVVEDRHGSPSFVIISGRHGSGGAATDATTTPTTTLSTDASTTPATTTLTTETTTSPATTTPAAEARNTPPPSTTVFGSTLPAAPNTTSPYLVLLRYLRPLIFGRFGGAQSTTSGTEATPAVTPALSTIPPNSNPATTESTLPTTVAAATSTTTVPSSTTQSTTTRTTKVLDEDLASYPAEFRVTELPGPFTTKDPLGNANATFTRTLPTTRQHTARGAAFDTTATRTPPPPNSFVSTTVAPGTTPARTTVALASDSVKARASIFSTSPVLGEPTTPVPSVTSDVTDADAPTTRSFATPATGTTVTGEDLSTPEGATTEVPTSARTGAPGQLGSLVSRLTDESATMGGLDGVTFAPWPRTTALKATGGGDDEPKYRYFYDPMQVMQIL